MKGNDDDEDIMTTLAEQLAGLDAAKKAPRFDPASRGKQSPPPSASPGNNIIQKAATTVVTDQVQRLVLTLDGVVTGSVEDKYKTLRTRYAKATIRNAQACEKHDSRKADWLAKNAAGTPDLPPMEIYCQMQIDVIRGARTELRAIGAEACRLAAEVWRRGMAKLPDLIKASQNKDIDAAAELGLPANAAVKSLKTVALESLAGWIPVHIVRMERKAEATCWVDPKTVLPL